MSIHDYTPQLYKLMAQANLKSLAMLYQATGVPRSQIQRLRLGQGQTLPVASLIKLSQVLQTPMSQLLEQFIPESLAQHETSQRLTVEQELHTLKAEYQRLHAQIENQQQISEQQFQQTVLQILEPLLLQWPTMAHAAQKNPQAPAVKILPLFRYLDQLLQAWGIEPIGTVGEETAYNPQWHQPREGLISADQTVRISHVGYRRGQQILYRAKVNALPASS